MNVSAGRNSLRVLRGIQGKKRLLSSCLELKNEDDKSNYWSPLIEIGSSIRTNLTPLSNGLHDFFQETQKLVSPLKSDNDKPNEEKDENGFNAEAIKNSTYMFNEPLPPESVAWLLSHLKTPENYCVKHTNDGIATGICLPYWHQEASSINCKCDNKDYLMNDNSKLKCIGDFYDDNITSRSCCKIDMNQLTESLLRFSQHDKALLLMSDRQNTPVINHSQNKDIDKNQPDDPSKKPNRDQLNAVQDHIAEKMPKFFVQRHDFRVYTQDIEFQNNIAKKSYTTKGISRYAMELTKLHAYAYLRYANVRLSVLKTTADEDLGIVQVRWRLSGIPQSRAFMFWKFLPWRYRSSKDTEAEWLDGFSTLHINGDGLIYKHVMDNVMPDNEKSIDEAAVDIKTKLARKIGLQAGLSSSASSFKKV